VLALHLKILSNHASHLLVLLLSKELELVIQVLDFLSFGWQHKSECVLSILGHSLVEGGVGDLPAGRVSFSEKFEFFRG